MEYPILKTLYYKNREGYDKERAERPRLISATALPLDIHGEPAYYINCQELTGLLSDCYSKARVLQSKARKLPGVALAFYERNCLVDEIMLSNDLEGIRSTRREIQEIIDAAPKAQEKKVRLDGMVKKYLRLLDRDEEIDLNSCASIRKLYDELIAGEIEAVDLPDGLYFRKDSVSVVSATDKEKHKGVAPPEENIIQCMENAISLIRVKTIPELVRVALLHYFLGYIHPFYDGNGRLSRFISSYLLIMWLDELTALRLSYAIQERKSKYYDAFDIVNDPKNGGDTTPFILAFLKIILAAENSLIEKIDQGMERLSFYGKTIKVLDGHLDEESMRILYVLIQNRLFGAEPLTIRALAKAVKSGESKTREKVKALGESMGGTVVSAKRDGHRFVYEIDLDELEEYCESVKTQT